MFYHLSTDLSQTTPSFSPRIPHREKRMKGEDAHIPRVCVARSIKDCLSAMPEGGYILKNEDAPKRMRVYEFDEDDIHPKNLIRPADLYFSEWVLDAWITGEYWVVHQEVVPVRCYDIFLDSIQVCDAPYVGPSTFRKAYEKNGDPEKILDELEENSNESIARVTELSYHIIQENDIRATLRH